MNLVKELMMYVFDNPDIGLDLLKLPLKCLDNEDLETTIRELKKFKKQNNFINYEVLNDLALQGKINLGILAEYEILSGFDEHFYTPKLLEYHINYYSNKILEQYKEKTIEKLKENYATRKITLNELTEKLKVIDTYKLDNSSNFKDIHDIEITEDKKTYILSNTKELDKNIKGFALGELSVWSGGNASSKSTYMNQLALESINQNYNVAIYSGELTSNRLLQWITLQASNKEDVIENKGFYKPKYKDKILYWLDTRLFIYDNDLGNKKDTLLESIQDIAERKNVKVIIIDNLMSIELSNQNKYDEQSILIKELSNLAKKLNIHIHFVCHPRKVMTFLRKNDISGTADLTNIADNVFILHRVGDDFKNSIKETKHLKDDNPIFQFTNVIEICKNREYGVQDVFVGMYYEKETKRLLDHENEKRHYGWEQMRS
jgi:archaellum biogenesis ATPase FlaH